LAGKVGEIFLPVDDLTDGDIIDIATKLEVFILQPHQVKINVSFCGWWLVLDSLLHSSAISLGAIQTFH
jgi:hypothetical protein